MATKLQEHYEKTVRPKLMAEFKYANQLQAPRIEKIVVNMGVGEGTQDAKKVDAALGDLAKITGQRPVKTKSTKAIAQFKLREGIPVGLKVTLRKHVMYEFLDRLIHIALPRVRDFRGVNPKSFDGNGNYSMGVSEQMIFPEIEPDKVTFTQGMDITFVTSTRNDDEARELLRAFGMPFRES